MQKANFVFYQKVNAFFQNTDPSVMNVNGDTVQILMQQYCNNNLRQAHLLS